MRLTNEINYPMWQDILDRDDVIEILTDRIADAEALLHEICVLRERNEPITKTVNLEWNGVVVELDRIAVSVTREWYERAAKAGGRA